ncbi:hypothetical protein SAMN05216359_10316 [Roseateles sp. YR242]|uniref:O-antigen ligase family protein n=1 Tax=Roseateles sp. YR242 TaxID=1855305 RepID=UPI0008B3C9B4|nr:hypothetical protein [Roseateles sp. YR242]SEK76943.1 hypothetical protein SAMN05216359_10316 [Roseateles sp. YR242]
MNFMIPLRASAVLALFASLACGALGVTLARHYPIEPQLMLTVWAMVAAAGFLGWQVLPMLLPALVPLIGFAPWTGWISFEELDLLVLAIATGGYMALAITEPTRRPVPWRYRTLRWRSAVGVLLAVFTLSVVISVWRGVEHAGGLQFGYWQGYQESMNSLRLGKSLGLVLLLLPLWQQAADLRPAAVQRLSRGAWVLVLIFAAVGAVWERWIYTGLLDFSTDYRTTSWFWEMHVGGAALDGCLALSMPMALLWMLREREPWRFAAALAVLVLGFYACLTTFSRGVYLAVPVGLALCALLWSVQRRQAVPEEAPASYLPGDATLPLRSTLAVLAVVALAAWVLFGAGGYRGLLALAASVGVWVAMPSRRASWPPAQNRALLGLALLPALLIAGAGYAVIDLVPKLSYGVALVVVVTTLAMCWQWRQGVSRPGQAYLLAAGWLATLAAAWLVAAQWSGGRDPVSTAAVLAVLGLGWLATQWPVRPIDPIRQAGWRVRGLLWTACLLVCGVVASLGGGGYIGQRLSTGQQDLEGRLDHWGLSLGLLKGTDAWLLGQGTGRFPSSFANNGPFESRVGDYRWNAGATDLVPGALDSAGFTAVPYPTVTLTSGLHNMGSGEMFRLSQRVSAVGGDVGATVVLRTRQHTQVRVEVCEKHLLYPLRCLDKQVEVDPLGGNWQVVRLPLGKAPDDFGGARWAPRQLTASVALNWRGSLVELRSVEIADGQHGPLLRNNDFSQGMARWFFSSDRIHMPFHEKSLPLHVLFEQGVIGLALWCGLLASALWRCTLGAARRHPLAPATAGALAGFVIVGLFDSLVDAPRIGFLFYAMLALALGLRTPSRRLKKGEEPEEEEDSLETRFAGDEHEHDDRRPTPPRHSRSHRPSRSGVTVSGA